MEEKVEDLENEIWKPVAGYEGWYSVSNLGRVRRDKKVSNTYEGRIFFLGKRKEEYPRIKLTRYGKAKHALIHRLVTRAFIGESPKGKQVNHIDGNKLNNRVDNLEYVSPSENVRHAHDMKLVKPLLGIKNHQSKLKEENVLLIRKLYKENKYSPRELGIMFNVHKSNIRYILKRTTWKHI